jgi:hypothetical protein
MKESMKILEFKFFIQKLRSRGPNRPRFDPENNLAAKSLESIERDFLLGNTLHFKGINNCSKKL